MAKTIAPLFSLTAHGRLGDQIHYQRTPAGVSARANGTSRFLPTTTQSLRQSLYSSAALAWRTRDLTTLDNEAFATVLASLSRQAVLYNAWLSNALSTTPDGRPWAQPRWAGENTTVAGRFFFAIHKDGHALAARYHVGTTPACTDESADCASVLGGTAWGQRSALNTPGVRQYVYVTWNAADGSSGRTPTLSRVMST